MLGRGLGLFGNFCLDLIIHHNSAEDKAAVVASLLVGHPVGASAQPTSANDCGHNYCTRISMIRTRTHWCGQNNPPMKKDNKNYKTYPRFQKNQKS